ncbi:hypothetical protein D3C76_1595410 [compost metagenome]
MDRIQNPLHLAHEGVQPHLLLEPADPPQRRAHPVGADIADLHGGKHGLPVAGLQVCLHP